MTSTRANKIKGFHIRSLTNRCFSGTRRLQRIYFPPGCNESFAVMITSWQLQDVLASPANQLRRQHQKVGAHTLQSATQIFGRQTQPLEPVHEIKSQQQYLEE